MRPVVTAGGLDPKENLLVGAMDDVVALNPPVEAAGAPSPPVDAVETAGCLVVEGSVLPELIVVELASDVNPK